jgi:hypothetical protein
MENTYQTFIRFKFSLNQLFQRVFFHNFAVGKTENCVKSIVFVLLSQGYLIKEIENIFSCVSIEL